MSKQTYTLATSKGFEQVTVDASVEAHEIFYALLRSAKHYRALLEEFDRLISHIKEGKAWAESALKKSELNPFVEAKDGE